MKGIGGGLDVMHSFVVIFLAILLFFHGLNNYSLGPVFIIILAIGLVFLEIIGLVG